MQIFKNKILNAYVTNQLKINLYFNYERNFFKQIFLKISRDTKIKILKY